MNTKNFKRGQWVKDVKTGDFFIFCYYTEENTVSLLHVGPELWDNYSRGGCDLFDDRFVGVEDDEVPYIFRYYGRQDIAILRSTAA